jgi:hypothetical protein
MPKKGKRREVLKFESSKVLKLKFETGNWKLETCVLRPGGGLIDPAVLVSASEVLTSVPLREERQGEVLKLRLIVRPTIFPYIFEISLKRGS